MRALSFVIAAAGATVACAGQDPAEWRSGRDVAHAVPELTIGATDGPEEYLFDEIQDLLPARNGVLWVVDGPLSGGGSPMVRQFDSSGRYLRTVGRRGAGPGEYRAPYAFGELPDGRVLLRDMVVQNRINVYEADGTPSATWTFPTPFPWGGGARRSSIQVDTGGVVWLPFSPGFRRPGMPPTRTEFVRLRSDGSIIDTVLIPRRREASEPAAMASVTSRTPSGGTSTFRMGVPYRPGNIWALSPHGYFATAHTARYAIDLHIPRSVRADGPPPVWREGDPVKTVRRRAAQVAVSREERADRVAYIEAQLAQREGRRSGGRPEIPETKPPIRGLLFDEDRRLWVRVSVPSERYDPRPAAAGGGPPSALVLPWREPNLYDVFEPNGTYLRRVLLPDRLFIVRMRGDRVWGVVRDELGVPVVKRYRIERT